MRYTMLTTKTVLGPVLSVFVLLATLSGGSLSLANAKENPDVKGVLQIIVDGQSMNLWFSPSTSLIDLGMY